VQNAVQHAADDGFALNAGKQQILLGIANQSRQHAANYARQEQNARAQLDQEQRNYEGQEHMNQGLRAIAGLKQRALAELPPVAAKLWLQQLSTQAQQGQQQVVLDGVGRILLELLARKSDAPPNANALNAVSAAVVELTAQPNLPPQAIQTIAEKHVRSQGGPELASILIALGKVQAQLEKKQLHVQDPSILATFADAIVGRAEAFLEVNGARWLVVRAMAGAPDDATRQFIAREGPAFAQSIIAAEAGATQDYLKGTFTEDMIRLAQAGVSPHAVAAAHPKIPADSVVKLTSIGLMHNREVDAWCDQMTELFSTAGNNKEHARALRSVVSLSQRRDGDASRMADALLNGKTHPQAIPKVASAILDAHNYELPPEVVEQMVGMLDRGEDVAGVLRGRLEQEMARKLELEHTPPPGTKKPGKGERVYKAKQPKPLSQTVTNFLALAANQPNFDKQLLKSLAESANAGTYPQFRFTTRATARALRSLTPDQRQEWEKSQTMTHVRFQGNAQREFDARVNSAAKLAGEVYKRMTAAWGDVRALERKHANIVEQLRNIPKGDAAARKRVLRELDSAPSKIQAMRWAKELSQMTPATTTPLRFARMADNLTSLGRMLGPDSRPMIEELMWTIRIDDLAYSEVVTGDGPDLEKMLKLVSGTCIGGGNDSALLAYCVDPNKRMIYTHGQNGENRRAVLRLVERQDQGHAGEPMLLLECPYPRGQITKDERHRLIEHALRRAADMGVSVAYPTEYYWDASKTSRFQGQAVNDMNAVIEDLNRRYNTKLEMGPNNAPTVALRVLNPAGNMPQEYIDSAPTQGARGAGQAEIRRYNGQQDHVYENRFVVLSPKD
jgi:hypothetical protein